MHYKNFTKVLVILLLQNPLAEVVELVAQTLFHIPLAQDNIVVTKSTSIFTAILQVVSLNLILLQELIKS
jgi:hypothetical protein